MAASIVFFFILFSFTQASPYAKPTNSSFFTDKTALLTFKNSISSDPVGPLSNWQHTTNHCLWYGVVCDAFSNRVVALNITGNLKLRSPESGQRGYYVAGSLPESIAGLTELRSLCLKHNAFSGEIPGTIGEFEYLEVLELQGNNFSGRIPDDLSNVRSLRLLNLSYNSLSGSLPRGLIGGGVLSVVDLSNNQLNGGIIVDNASSCEFLRHLKLSDNYFVNEIPGEIGKCWNLRTLLLDGNILEGRIPAEIGRISELRILDVSRNSLTDSIPKEVGGCRKLSVVVLTNPVDFGSERESLMLGARAEFNAFIGGIPDKLLLLPSLQVLWAPRANLGARLPGNWSDMCSLRVLNLGQNYITGAVPESLGRCRNLTFLDLSSNYMIGHLSPQLQVPCMVYFNISQNNVSGVIPSFEKGSCDYRTISYGEDPNSLGIEDLQNAYSSIPAWGSKTGLLSWLTVDGDFAIIHDFSWNRFVGSLPLFSAGDTNYKFSYRLFLNNNKLSGPFPRKLVRDCSDLLHFSVNLSTNQLTGGIYEGLILDCLQLTELEAAHNVISGSIGPDIGSLVMLDYLDLTGNKLNGSLPTQLGKLKNLKQLLLGENDLTEVIPSQLGQLASLTVLNLSHNALTGSIPASLANVSSLGILLLDHNKLSGEIPASFSMLSSLIMLDLSFNNLSGRIPDLQHISDCEPFKGNMYLHSCPDSNSGSPAGLPVPLDVDKWKNQGKLKSLIIAVVASASVVFCTLLVIVSVFVFGKRKPRGLTSLRRKVIVTFTDDSTDLNYENVVRATGNFSIRNLIGTGGFGSTYKAELAPGNLVAIKRLSIGRFQGIQQFEAEIRTLGRIRHTNLVTLIGYYVGEAEMFLIYNYLSGGNLETLIHDRSNKNVDWAVIHKIAMDVAEALTYLHYSCVPRIVHRDIKPSNILLDEDLNAYLSDFGLARLLEVSETHATTDVAGTFGYVAPEYATTCRVTDKADVYSFGVVLLELLSGKKSLDPSFSEYGDGFNIVEWTKWLIKEERSSELFCPGLWEAGPKDNLLGMLRLASVCTEESLSVRPTMKQVLERLKQLKS